MPVYNFSKKTNNDVSDFYTDPTSCVKDTIPHNCFDKITPGTTLARFFLPSKRTASVPRSTPTSCRHARGSNNTTSGHSKKFVSGVRIIVIAFSIQYR